MSFSPLIISILTGLMLGSLYALIGVSLTFIFGVLGFVNSAHGQLMMIGAFITYWMLTLYGIPPLLSLIISAGVGSIIGFLTYFSIVRRLLNVPMLYSLSAAFALGIFIQELANVLWGPNYRGFLWNIGSIKYESFYIPLSRIVGSFIGLGIILMLYFFLYKTRQGLIIRSIIQSKEGALLCGINAERVYLLALVIGIVLNVLSGSLLTFFVSSGINPYMGDVYTNIAFIIAVMGGLGSPEGALLAGLIYGLAESLFLLGFSYVPGISAYSATRFMMFAILMIVLLLRPEGLMKK
jgi:branched-chain amino acid transport system permease protein